MNLAAQMFAGDGNTQVIRQPGSHSKSAGAVAAGGNLSKSENSKVGFRDLGQRGERVHSLTE
jgi:hypothetical protein